MILQKNNTYKAYTLIELLVSITIFSIIIISVLSIFLFASQMSTRVELNRMMQENIKNVLEDMAEGVRKNGITGVRNIVESCSLVSGTVQTHSGSIACIGNSEYALGVKNLDGSFSLEQDCRNIEKVCYILRKQYGGNWYPMTNSFIAFQSLEFTVSNSAIPKIQVTLEARPAIKKGMTMDVILKNTFFVQTTLSERLIKTQ